MKTKQLLSAIAFAVAATASTASMAQVKIGANPTAISTGAHLDVESSINTHTVVLQSGAVGINTALPQAWLDIRGTTKILSQPGEQTGTIWTGTSNIDGVEISAGAGDAWVGIQRRGGAPLHLSKPTGTIEESFIIFSVSGVPGGVGAITYNGAGGVIYGTTSDKRLKENIHATKFGLEALKAVKIYDYNYKADSKKKLATGVLAQELHQIYPQAVRVGGDDEKTKPWQVDYSKLVPMLVKSVQELNEKVESLESEKSQLSAELKRKEASYTELNNRVSQLERLFSGANNTKSVSR
ncbi:Chaperone of endosialidase [Dyadobacter soli]|uniref:Chaperone of endosialidase n=1 Tax=Dyadobacter soli TaxID=659014 RepID=A0A1G8BUX2_9BACT|nr:tail fiber domain-containing protein [Dyadobacter soli]SDH37076.1 Chaperone of endosialidase [Dyadobacter soli]